MGPHDIADRGAPSGAPFIFARQMGPWRKAGAASCSPAFIFQRRIFFVGADIIRPMPDYHRAGSVAKQAAVGSAEGGAVKQSEAILDGVFLSSPILSFARKRKNGKKKKRILYVGFPSTQRYVDAAPAPRGPHAAGSPRKNRGLSAVLCIRSVYLAKTTSRKLYSPSPQALYSWYAPLISVKVAFSPSVNTGQRFTSARYCWTWFRYMESPVPAEL